RALRGLPSRRQAAGQRRQGLHGPAVERGTGRRGEVPRRPRRVRPRRGPPPPPGNGGPPGGRQSAGGRAGGGAAWGAGGRSAGGGTGVSSVSRQGLLDSLEQGARKGHDGIVIFRPDQVQWLSEIARFPHVTSLTIAGGLTALPREIGSLTNLNRLELCGNQL